MIETLIHVSIAIRLAAYALCGLAALLLCVLLWKELRK